MGKISWGVGLADEMPFCGRVAASPPAGNRDLYNESCAGLSSQVFFFHRPLLDKRRSHFHVRVSNRRAHSGRLTLR
jgi:hypothetical protein